MVVNLFQLHGGGPAGGAGSLGAGSSSFPRRDPQARELPPRVEALQTECLSAGRPAHGAEKKDAQASSCQTQTQTQTLSQRQSQSQS